MSVPKFAVLFASASELRNKPASCFDCSLFYQRLGTCKILGPRIQIQHVRKNGSLYTPVCGQQDPGAPDTSSSPRYTSFELSPEKADAIGLEWSKGTGATCGGAADSAGCVHFQAGQCQGVLDRPVEPADCCAAHEGPSIPWREAQEILKGEKGANARLGRILARD